MSWVVFLLPHAAKVAVLAVLVGIFARGYARRCLSFVAYLVAVLIGNSLVTLWPSQFQNPSIWVVKQAVYDVLKFIIAVELTYRTVKAFPGAAAMARASSLVVLVLSLAAITSGKGAGSYQAVFEWQPRITVATIWMFTLTALLVLWYHLPIHAWHRVILLGFAPYLFVFGTLIGLLQRKGWAFGHLVAVLDSVAYVGVLCWWAFGAWRPAEALEGEPEVIRQLGLEPA